MRASCSVFDIDLGNKTGWYERKTDYLFARCAVEMQLKVEVTGNTVTVLLLELYVEGELGKLKPLMMETSPKSARIFRWSRRYVVLCSAVVAITVGFTNWFFDSLMAHYFPHIGVKVMSDAFSGISAGIIFKLLVTAAWERKAIVAERLRLIAEMNHHIRNGLEIISLSAYTAKDKNTVETMKYGVEKIEWALREVLPKLPQGGSL